MEENSNEKMYALDEMIGAVTPPEIHISRGISKLGDSIPSMNLPPVITCRADAPCLAKCYARKGRFAFKKTKNNMMDNLEVWKEDPKFFETVAKRNAFYSRFFRWHSAGDMPDKEYFEMMVRIAEELPHTSFLAFTKKYEIVNEYMDAHEGHLPENLHMVLSAWDEFIPVNPYNLPMSCVRLKHKECEVPSDAYECSGYCGECVLSGRSCWDLKKGESVVFNEH